MAAHGAEEAEREAKTKAAFEAELAAEAERQRLALNSEEKARAAREAELAAEAERQSLALMSEL